MLGNVDNGAGAENGNVAHDGVLAADQVPDLVQQGGGHHHTGGGGGGGIGGTGLCIQVPAHQVTDVSPTILGAVHRHGLPLCLGRRDTQLACLRKAADHGAAACCHLGPGLGVGLGLLAQLDLLGVQLVHLLQQCRQVGTFGLHLSQDLGAACFDLFNSVHGQTSDKILILSFRAARFSASAFAFSASAEK